MINNNIDTNNMEADLKSHWAHIVTRGVIGRNIGLLIK